MYLINRKLGYTDENLDDEDVFIENVNRKEKWDQNGGKISLKRAAINVDTSLLILVSLTYLFDES